MENTIRQGLTAYHGVPGARHSKAPEEVPRDEYAPGEARPEAEEEPRKKRHLLRKMMVGTALTLTAAGAAGVGATYVAAHAPICQDPHTAIAVTDNGLCVSPEIGLAGAHGWRILSGAPEVPGAIESLHSTHNQVSHPDGSRQPPAGLMDTGTLKTVTFNLHHERSPDSIGARDQTGDIVDALRAQKADVYLLQEVTPGHVDELVNGLGMDGYYSQTTTMQGNLILVHPDLQVTGESSHMIANGASDTGDAIHNLWEWGREGGGTEPRSIQTVEVELPNGKSALLWNTHQPTVNYTDQQRIEGREKTMEALQQESRPGQIVIGGGDLNAGADGSLASMLRAEGHEVHAYHIDAINTKNAAGEVKFRGFHLNDSHGFHLSDHPMAVAEIPV